MFAKVIIDISHEKLDKPFDYIIPDSLIDAVQVGSRVNIPFGRGNREIKGYVIDITDSSDFEPSRMKEIISIDEKDIEAEGQLIELAWWMKENYGSTMNQALKIVLPVKEKIKRVEKKTIVLNLSGEELEEKLATYKKKNAKARVRLLEELKKEKRLSRNLVVDKLNISSSTLKSLEELGDIVIESSIDYRNPIDLEEQPEYDIILNDEQRKVADEIFASMKKTWASDKTWVCEHSRVSVMDEANVHLIHGITGSGKTEVYMELISECIKEGKQAIVLIPEIALTYQTVMRFTRKFKDDVSIINSRMSKGERFDQFERAKAGDINIMIGPRSALFTPFRNLGLIIIDEEHETSYKSEPAPKYHAVEVAKYRASMTGSTVVLGSATPSVESYYLAKQGVYKLHELNKREKGELPSVHIVDLKEEAKNDNHSIFSHKLQDLIKDRLDRNQQTMLFLNRRGFSGFVSCKDCGEAIKCPHCDVTLKLHKNRKMMCHYCGYTIKQPSTCPECGSKYLGAFGIGTQQVEKAIKELFPEARVLRMDADTTTGKTGHEEILSAFANKEADILVGTQMIVKGHDFPDVTLVGILAAELSLNMPDYTAAERTFQLLCQAAGRAGRGNAPGDVVIQSYEPDNYAIQSASRQDYKEFYEHEIAFRKLMLYPPTQAMVSIMIQDKNEKRIDVVTSEIEKLIRQIKDEKCNKLMIIGPSEPPVAKIKDVHRRVLYMKDENRSKMVNVKNYVEYVISQSPKMKDTSVQFDFKV